MKETLKRKRFFRLGVKVLAFLAVFATAYALIMPAVTLSAKERFCNLEEHVHTEECPEECPYEEHIHTEICESNPKADVEEEEDWTAAFANIIDESPCADKLARIAASQIGIQSSVDNFVLNEEQERVGYNRYGAWTGHPYLEDWSLAFVRFCLSYSQAPFDLPEADSVSELIEQNEFHESLNFVRTLAGPGDLVFYDLEENPQAAIVTETGEGSVKAAGRVGDEVAVIELDMSEDGSWAFVRVFDEEAQAESLSLEENLSEEQPSALSEESSDDADPDPADPPAEPEEGCGFKTHFPVDKITSWDIQYRGSGDADWRNYTSDVKLNSDQQVRLVVNYQNLTKAEIEAADEGKYHFSLPDFLQSTESQIGTDMVHTENSNNFVIGKMQSCLQDPSHMHLNMNNYQAIASNVITSGTFYVSMSVNLEKAAEPGEKVIRVGESEKSISFIDNLLETKTEIRHFNKSQKMTGSSNVRQDEDGRIFADYQISFETGGTAVPDVILDDWFEDNHELMVRYVPESFQMILNNGEPVSIPLEHFKNNRMLNAQGNAINSSPLNWQITTPSGKTIAHTVHQNGMSVYLGEIPPHTTCTFVYSIEANADALKGGDEHMSDGNHQANSISMRNKARLYSGPVERSQSSHVDTCIKATVRVEKDQLGVTKDAQGNWIIDYTVRVKANDGNQYILRDVDIQDDLTARPNRDHPLILAASPMPRAGILS